MMKSCFYSLIALLGLMTASGEAADVYVGVSELQHREVLYVDLRESAQNTVPRADTLQISGHQLLAKSFLKSRQIILVDEGWGDPKTEILAKRLRQRGFASVQILRGGGPVLDTARSGQSTFSISLPARNFVESQTHIPWHIILVDQKLEPSEQPLFHHSAAVHHSSAEELEGLVWELRARDEHSWILVLPVEGTVTLHSQLELPFFELEGGVSALKQEIFNRDQLRIASGKSQVDSTGIHPTGLELFRKPCELCP